MKNRSPVSPPRSHSKPFSNPRADILDAVREQLPMSITDSLGTILEVNDAFCRLSGYDEKQLVGRTHRVVNSGVHSQEVFADMWRQLKSGASWRGELCNRNADGSLYWVDTVISPLRNARGAIDSYASMRFDITERVLQRQALEAAQERLRAATEAGEIGIWELDVAKGNLHWDVCMHCLHGVGEEVNVTSIPQWFDSIHPGDRSRVDEALREAVLGCGVFEEEFRVVWSDGSVHLLHAAGQVKKEARGQALRAVGVTWDVTNMRRMGSELERQKELLRVALEAITDAVITSDTAGRVTWLNPAAVRVTGWTVAEAVGTPLAQVCPLICDERAEPSAPLSNLAKLADGGRLVRTKARLIAHSGTAFDVLVTDSAMYDASDEEIGIVTVLNDVTEQHRLGGEIQYRDTHDKLTGLINRSEFEVRMGRLIGHRSGDANHALLYIDLDQFKIVNDACGHSIGDQALRQVADLIGSCLREQDTPPRGP